MALRLVGFSGSAGFREHTSGSRLTSSGFRDYALKVDKLPACFASAGGSIRPWHASSRRSAGRKLTPMLTFALRKRTGERDRRRGHENAFCANWRQAPLHTPPVHPANLPSILLSSGHLLAVEDSRRNRAHGVSRRVVRRTSPCGTASCEPSILITTAAALGILPCAGMHRC
jgi:hypothetical protein